MLSAGTRVGPYKILSALGISDELIVEYDAEE